MKAVCNKEKLSEAIAKVSKAVSVRSTMPVLEGILFVCDKDIIRLTGYDLEMGIVAELEAEISEPGSVVLSSRLFADMIRRMPDDRVSISCESNLFTTVTSGDSEFNILGLPAADFPELPIFQNEMDIQLPQNVLKRMIRQSIFAVSTSEAKPVQMGTLFHMEGGQLDFVSQDGYRMAVSRQKVDNISTARFIVPGKTLGEVMRLAGDTDETLAITVGKKHAKFTLSGCEIYTRLITEGEFLDYNAIIPKAPPIRVKINTRNLMEAVERLSLLISEKVRTPVVAKFSQNTLGISCATAMGKAQDKLYCDINGGGLEIGFNNRYMLDALRAAETEEVMLEMSTPFASIKITPPEGESFVFLVMPVRTKGDG